MSKNSKLLFLISIVFSFMAHGQDEDTRLKERVYAREYRTTSDSFDHKPPTGKIRVIQDSRITKLDSLKKEYPGLQDGYRVQIFFGKRKDALEQKAAFAETYPDLAAYISYLAPNFRLRVGDFRTRLEGEKLKQRIESDYPGCYLVKDKIELPSLEKDAQLNSEKTQPTD